jgi:hemerythrin-like domain-containing protein
MVTVLPSTGSVPASQPRCDTSDMVLVHGLLRRLFVEAAGVVRTVGHAQPIRRSNVISHVRMIADMLHQHHRTEDVLLWDDLEQRAPSCALHVGLMRRQHADMAQALDALTRHLDEWDVRGGADDGSVSCDLERIRGALDRHFGQEETGILPFAEQVFTQAEWDKLGEMGGAHTPRQLIFVQLGYLIASLPEHSADAWLRGNLPAPVRLLWRLVGARRFARYRRALAVDA